jgi:hypothetical protein
MTRPVFLPVLAGLLLLLGGCTSYDAQIERNHSFTGVKRLFVVSNQNDNHGLDRLVANSLIARGFVAETGPLTMMGDDTQAIVMYEDHWTWDFGDHLVHLQLTVRDPKSPLTYAMASFGAKVPSRQPTSVIVDELVAKLLAARKT